MDHPTDDPTYLDAIGDDSDDAVHEAARRVLDAARGRRKADIGDQIDTAMLITFLAEALSATISPDGLTSFTNLDEIRIGFAGALRAMSTGLARIADTAESRPDLCRRPNLRPTREEDRQFRRDLIEGWRVASGDERRVLAGQMAAHFRTAAGAVADSHSVLGEVPFARFSDPDLPVSKQRAARQAERYREAFETVPEQRTAPAPAMTSLYRWFDADGELLYIGISGELALRQNGHSKKSSWSDFASTSTVERFATRDEARAAERAAIEAEQPLFNGTHNDSPEARQRLIAYLVKHDRLDLLAPAVSRG